MKKTKVQQIVKKSMKSVLIEEGWMDNLQNAGKIVGGTLKTAGKDALIGAAGGVAVGVLLSAFGAIEPRDIFGTALLGATTGFAVGVVTGGARGYKIQKSFRSNEHEVQLQKLIDITNARDELFKRAANGEKVGAQIIALTNQQKNAQKLASKLVDNAESLGLIDKDNYEIYSKIADVAQKGKFTYLQVGK